jgi:hypothetical protein
VAVGNGEQSGGSGRSLRGSLSRVRVAVLPLVLLLAACGGDDVRGDDGRVVAAGPWSVFDLRPGDCIGADDSLSGDVDEVPLVPCSEPHAQEVFAVVRHPDDAYPGAGAVATFADRACLTALEADLDLTIDDGIAFSYLLPTFEGWNKNGDRSVVCVLVFPEEAGMIGSFVEGTGDPSRLTVTDVETSVGEQG